MNTVTAKFTVGQLIHHTLFDYRGVIIDVDPCFHGESAEWHSNPAPTVTMGVETPWYHVLVDGAEQRTYVAERNLEVDAEGGPVHHPDVDIYFETLSDNGYVARTKHN